MHVQKKSNQRISHIEASFPATIELEISSHDTIVMLLENYLYNS